MKKTLKQALILMLSCMLLLSFTGCGAKPEAAAKNFLDAVKQQDFAKASTFVNGDTSKDEFKYDNAEQEKMVKAIFSKVDYTLGETTISGNTATVKAKITSLDLSRIMSKTISELLPTLMAQGASSEKPDQEKQSMMIYQYLLNSINDSNAPKTQTEVTIKLVKDKKGWLVEPDDDLLNALTGNLEKAVDSLNAQ